MVPRVVCDHSEIDRMIDHMCGQIVQQNQDLASLALVGIHTRGVPLARRLAVGLEARGAKAIPFGTLDITFYRDDVDSPDFDPRVHDSDLHFDLTGRRVILVDDVLYTGRTIRAAMDALFDLGRPAQIQLAVLVERAGRELPIAATYFGQRLDVGLHEIVRVRLSETDGSADSIVVMERRKGGRSQ